MQDFNIFNSLKKSKSKYESNGRDSINIYSCGPTVYDHSHIGHARSAITWDFIVRFLRFIGYKVNWTRNITDIDDKIINKSKEQNIDPAEIARIYTSSFHKDMINLNIDEPNHEPKATEYLEHMFNIIESLLAKGIAYRIDNDVYFSVTSFKNYGQLKGQSIEELEKGFGRIEPNPKKKHPLDFALWKGIKNNEYCFNSPWGKGRPGWHLECSAMCKSIYSTELDIHCGGDDLIFPHHENEIAQSESAVGPFARYWLHNGMIMVNGKKMSKSEGNFITIKESLKAFSGNAIRFFTLNSHYRMPLNYTEEGLTAAENGVNRLIEALSDIGEPLPKEVQTQKIRNEYVNDFIQVMSDDFNSPKALAILFKLVDLTNTEKDLSKKAEFQITLLFLSNILGFDLKNNNFNEKLNDSFSKIIDNLVIWRSECKIKKDYSTADKLRQILEEGKVQLKDASDSLTKWQVKL